MWKEVFTDFNLKLKMLNVDNLKLLLRREVSKNETFWAYSDPRGFQG